MSMYAGPLGAPTNSPAGHHVIHSLLAPDAARAALAAQITPRSWSTLFFPLFTTGRFSGQVTGYHFEITRIIRGRSNMRLLAVGDIYPDGRGSLIDYTLRIDPWVIAMSLLGLAIVLPIWLLTFRSLLVLLFLGVGLLVSVVFSKLSYDWEVREAVKFLDEVFRQNPPAFTGSAAWDYSVNDPAWPVQTQRLPQRWAGGSPEAQRYGPATKVWDSGFDDAPATDHETQRLPPRER